MTENNQQESSNEYNTAIKDIAALKDYTLIFNILAAYFNEPNSTKSFIIDKLENCFVDRPINFCPAFNRSNIKLIFVTDE